MNAEISRKRIATWVRVLLVIFGLILVIGLLLPFFVDADRYRTSIAVALESATGRKVTIGKIRAKFIPSVGFIVDDFHLSNPPGFPAGDLVSVDSVRGGLAFWPLLHKDIHVTSLELVHPKLTLLEDDSGKTNYSFATSAPDKAAGGGSSMQLSVIPSLTLSGIEVSLAHTSRGKIEPSLTARKVDVELGQVALDPLDIKRWTGKASLSGVEVAMAGWKEPLKFSSGTVKLNGGSLNVDFQAALGKAADIKGTVQVADLETGVTKFQLTTKEIDVDKLIAAQEATPPSGAKQVARPAKNELVAQGRITADRLRWQPYNANNLSAEIRVFTDRMEVWPLSLALYGGTLQVSARADRTQEPQRFSANIQLRNIDVNGVLSAASPTSQGKVTGIAELDLQLVGSVASDWQRPLTGTGKFTVRDGKLPGLNSGGAMGALAGGLNLKEIPYRLIEGDLNVGGARVASKNIHVDSPVAVVDLNGSFGLDNTLNYDGKLMLSAGAGGGGSTAAGIVTGLLGAVTKQTVSKLSIPLTITGTFSDPKVRPGAAMPVVEGAKTPANNAAPPKKSILDIFKKQ